MQQFTGLEYLMIDIANNFGLDKKLWSERLLWVTYNMSVLESLSSKAEVPELYNKAVAALRLTQQGKPVGHVMYLDATASGMGILALLSGCESTAAAVNLINTGKREDVYQFMADAINAVDRSLSITRNIIKKPLMTVWYNSQAKPKELLIEGSPAYIAFYKTLEDKFGGAYAAQMKINSCWNPKAVHHTWTLPDGHTAFCPVQESVDKVVKMSRMNSSFTYRAKMVTPSPSYLSLAANIVHSIDGYVCREMVKRCGAKGIEMITVHDAFGFHPMHGNTVRAEYVEILAEIAESNLLRDILNEIVGRPVSWTKDSRKLGALVRKSEYALS